MNRNPHMGVQCPQCGKHMFSYHRHDYRTCGCPNETMIDGGKDYLRCGGVDRPEVIEWNEEQDGKAVSKRLGGKTK